MWTGPAGDLEDSASYIKAKSIAEINQYFKGMNRYIFSDNLGSGRGARKNYRDNPHLACPNVSLLRRVVEDLVKGKTDEIVEFHRPHMTVQRQKLS